MQIPKLKFYNTLTNKVELFTPIKNGEVKMYTCGPTVYNYAHIGNFRAYLFMDILIRVLKYNDYNVHSVMNITDVGHLTDDQDSGEDKMLLAAKKENKSPFEIAKYYENAFFKDAEKLNINFSNVKTAKATNHIEDMIEFIKGIIDNGLAYVKNGNVYFNVEKYNNTFENKYGELSGFELNQQKAGARIDVNSDKKSPYDFALWIKAPKEHIMKWDSPWSIGYPGWHIECSAMGKKYLGNQFDIHTGGIDHVPIHHENEIAQSRGLTCNKEHTQANYWMHCEFLKIDGGKMSKSLGNIYTIKDLEQKGYSALDFRYFLLNANFRKSQNFTFKALESAKISRKRLNLQILDHFKEDVNLSNDDAYIKQLNDYKQSFLKAINYDLNIPDALSVMWDIVKMQPSKKVYNLILEFDKILGLNISSEVENLQKQKETSKDDIPKQIINIANERLKARQNKDFNKSDELRDKLKSLGYTVKDSKNGYEILKDR